MRYSFQKTHRDQPATLPHGDAGFTFGAGDGNIKAQSFAFNDTHTFSPSWLNEVRVGYSYIKFFMTSIDYGGNLADQVGIPGVNLNEVTSAFSQIQFEQGGSRNLGANAQPAAHHEPGQPADLRQRDAHPGPAHLQGRAAA